MSDDATVKVHKSYREQVALLASRGMDMGNSVAAEETLRRVNYYRLSGYWYPFRQQTSSGRLDDFYPGTKLSDVVALYEFDTRLRAATFASLAPVELAVRALLGYELGRIDPLVHLDPSLLGATARSGRDYPRWLKKLEREVGYSREDFVHHHRHKYGGKLPVWAAIEVMDWGALMHLYGFAPRTAQDAVANACGLSAPQLASWLKALNLVRNTCAHHGRLFNKVHVIAPKLPAVGIHSDLDEIQAHWNRTFGQLTLVRFLSDRLGVGRAALLPAVLRSYPVVPTVPLSHVGVPAGWERLSLWR